MPEPEKTECPFCHAFEFQEWGNIWMTDDKNLRISYSAECSSCNYSTSYDSVKYEW